MTPGPPAASRSARGAALPYKPSRRVKTWERGRASAAGIAADHRSGSQQFPPVIAIACVAERAPAIGAYALAEPSFSCVRFLPACVPGSREPRPDQSGDEAQEGLRVWGRARCLAACLVPSTSTTVQWLPRRSHTPPGGEANADRATRSS